MSYKSCSIIALVYVLCVIGSSMAGQPMEEQIAEAATNLGSTDYLEATNALNVLYLGGHESLPYIIRNFTDKSRYYGLCGQRTRQSIAIRTEIDAENLQEKRLSEQITVREVSLYILVAVLKKDLYYADVCKPVIAANDSNKILSDALDEISELYEDTVRTNLQLRLETVITTLQTHGVHFEEVGGN